MFRRKRRVRIHQQRRVRIHQQPGGPTLEGVALSRRPIGGHYVLILAHIVEEREDGEIRPVKLDAERVEIPKDRVVAIEVLAS